MRSGAARSFAADGDGPNSTVSANPGNLWLNHIVIVPWQLLPQFRCVIGRSSALATRRENAGRAVMSTPCSGWWKDSTYAGFTVDRNLIIARVSGSDAGLGPE